MKIVIVGGGTAGWVTAAMIYKYRKDIEVTVVESSKIPIIGAGEGSADSLTWFINEPWPNNVVNELDFMRKTKATPKLAINLKNWKGDGTSIYSPIHSSGTATLPVDKLVLASILEYGKSDMASLNSWILKDNLSPFDKQHKKLSQQIANYAYHFDGYEVGKYFKNICLKFGVKIIDSEVEDLIFDENENLKNVKLTNGEVLQSDLWIDCTGFNRVLMSKTKNKWISFKEELPVNAAIPFSDKISSNNVKFETVAETMNAGWLWKIPLHDRYGCGYVYCDEFQTYEQSLSELNSKLKYDIEPLKNIKFDCGRYENIWYKNIVAIGLSSHFLEPLQATSIHISILSATNLVLHSLKSKESIYSNSNVNTFNKTLNTVIDDYKDLLQMHYLSGREDTPFWKFAKNEIKISDANKDKIEISKYRLLNNLDVSNAHGTCSWVVWSHIFDNAGLFKKEFIQAEINRLKKLNDGDIQLKSLSFYYNNKVKPYLLSAGEMFKYLKI
ncbi:MAG: Cyanophage [Bacteroidota bacterium]|jgi:tryptophan halogenase